MRDPGYDATPAANGGRFSNRGAPSDSAARPSATRWSPRRIHYANRLAEYLAWRGGRIILDAATYADIARHWATRGMSRHDIDDAAELLHVQRRANVYPVADTWAAALVG
jgi:hypothetical protein